MTLDTASILSTKCRKPLQWAIRGCGMPRDLRQTRDNHAASVKLPRDTVLLVEDNEVNLKLLMALMRKLKYKFLCAINGREAVDKYRENPRSILLVLMDISMPVMDRFAATVKIREMERRQKLKRSYIAALTGVTSEEAKGQAFTSGIDEFYSKPVGMKAVKELMSKLQDRDDAKTRQNV